MDFNEKNWDTIIESKKAPFSLNIKQIIEYRDLIILFVKRDISTTYKQTILGPLWYLVQPIFTTSVFITVFRHVASLGTDGIPPVLFYSIGTILWSFFSSLLTIQARVFSTNKDIFGKVYFPRMTVPIAVIFSESVKFLIQFTLFAGIFVFYLFHGYKHFLSVKLLYLPLIIIWLVLMATGLGLIISSITTRYRDLAMVLSFILSMVMYASPVVYPLSEVSGKFKIIIALNPITAIVESFRYSCFSVGEISLYMILYSVACTVVFLLGGTVLFNLNEKSFVDVI